MRHIRKLMYTRLLGWVVLFILGLTGCKSVEYMEPFDAKGQRIVLVTLVPEKHVEFCETTLGTRIKIFPKVTDNMYAFKGIWEPELQIEASIMQALKSDEQFRDISVATSLGKGYRICVRKRIRQLTAKARGNIVH